ncbi:MAG: hypothetical protein VKI63_00130 [Cyanobium sp.]|nr:hypothetical protein [Cyanobium sp.]
MSVAPRIEFRFPAGGYCPLDRAIVYNSDLTWRQALPKHGSLWSSLQSQQVAGIARLARALRDRELTTRIASSWRQRPWQVMQWWNPLTADWSSGRRALLKPRDHSLTEALEFLAPSPELRVAPRSCDLVEVLVLRAPTRPPAP